MTTILKPVVNCDVLSLKLKKNQGTCFGHAFFKVCQYVIIANEKLAKVYDMYLPKLLKEICKNA